MLEQTFEYPPSVELLQWLARGSLKQTDILAMAIRLWVILRSLYASEEDPVYVGQQNTFTYASWQQNFFRDARTKHHRDAIPEVHDQQCPCAKTIEDWLFCPKRGIKKEQWQASLRQLYSLSEAEMDKILNPSAWVLDPEAGISNENFYQRYRLPKNEIDNLLRQVRYPERERNKNRPFAVSRKTLQKDFKTLVELGWLKFLGTEKTYSKKQYLPSPNIFNGNLSDSETSDFLDPELGEFARNFERKINGVSRFFLHLDYVVANKARDSIGTLQGELKKIWGKIPIPPIEITYESASAWRKVKCIVYPVCIYYYQRAAYLCTFGETPKKPKNEMKWYNYRLDRIVALTELNWEEAEIPFSLKQRCLGGQAPSPDLIQEQLAQALGFDFYKEKALMLLRFASDFHDRYIEGTIRHDTFQQIDLSRATKLIEQSGETEVRQQELLSVLKRCPNDSYYQLYYRIDDNNAIMKLRAWGPSVEVLLPYQLREKIRKDLHEACETYKQSL